jgi:hypothetical protein
MKKAAIVLDFADQPTEVSMNKGKDRINVGRQQPNCNVYESGSGQRG